MWPPEDHHLESVVKIAAAHRLMTWAFIAALVQVIVLPLVMPVFPIVLIFDPFLVYAAWRLTRALQIHPMIRPLILAFMIFPVANLLPIYLLNSRAVSVLRRADVRVGLMGAS